MVGLSRTPQSQRQRAGQNNGHCIDRLKSQPKAAIDASSSQIANIADHISYTCSVLNGDFTPVRKSHGLCYCARMFSTHSAPYHCRLLVLHLSAPVTTTPVIFNVPLLKRGVIRLTLTYTFADDKIIGGCQTRINLSAVSIMVSTQTV